jgi:DNA-binding IclR family transcriptional regulator
MIQKERVQSVERALSILEIVAEHDGIGLTDISKVSQLNKATVHRLLSTLISMGYVEQTEKTGLYGLTFKLFQLGNKKIEQIDSFKIARSFISELSNQIEETIHLVVEDNKEVVYIDKFEPSNLLFRMHSRVGKRAPMYCTAVGKALLSHYTDEIIKEVWDNSSIKSLTPHTITQFSTFMEEVAQIRSQGYAVDNEENEMGIYCIASVFYNHKGDVEGAISISIPMTRFKENSPNYYIDKALEYSSKISRALGYH